MIPSDPQIDAIKKECIDRFGIKIVILQENNNDIYTVISDDIDVIPEDQLSKIDLANYIPDILKEEYCVIIIRNFSDVWKIVAVHQKLKTLNNLPPVFFF